MERFLNDPVLRRLLRRFETDPDVIAILLGGSRAVGAEHEDSDYDLTLVAADAASTRLASEADSYVDASEARLQITVVERAALLARAATPGYWSFSLSTAHVLHDRTGGSIAEEIRAAAKMPADFAREWEQGYLGMFLNSFIRWRKASRRRDDLAATLHMSEAALHVVRLVATVARSWAPHVEYWSIWLPLIEPPGWDLEARLRSIVLGRDEHALIHLARDLIVLMEGRGVRDHGWGEELDPLLNGLGSRHRRSSARRRVLAGYDRSGDLPDRAVLRPD